MNKKVIVASGPVIIENGQVLLNQHGDDQFWKFPGGKIEYIDFKDWNNSLEEACIREAKEENGIDIEIICPIKPMLLPRPNSDELVVLIHYLTKRLNELQLPSDTIACRFFEIRKILNGEYSEENFAPNIIPVLSETLK